MARVALDVRSLSRSAGLSPPYEILCTSQELDEGLTALRLLNRLGREAVFTFEIMTTPAVFRIVAGQVLDVILGAVRHLLLMNANCTMAMHATYVISV